MNVDILEQLVPNVLTMITQLAATGVIFIIYKKYLHTPVLKYLDDRKVKREEDLTSAAALKVDAQKFQSLTKTEYENARVEILALREKMLEEARIEKTRIIESAKVEVDMLKKRNEQILENQRVKLYSEVNEYLLDVASEINKKVLQDYSFNEKEMLSALQKEMVSNDYQH